MALKTNCLANKLGQFFNRHFCARANIDVLFVAIDFGEMDNRICQVVDIEKLAPWTSRAPNNELVGTAQFCLMRFA